MSNVQSAPIKDGKTQARRHIEWNKIAAAIAWLIGTFTTWLFFAKAAPNLHWGITAGSAIVVQWLLTLAERPLWRWLMRRRGGRFVFISVLVTLFDALINAGGIYSYVGRISNTDVGTMISEVFNVSPQIDARSAFVVAYLIGLILAGLPEALWQYDERG